MGTGTEATVDEHNKPFTSTLELSSAVHNSAVMLLQLITVRLNIRLNTF